MDWPQVMTDVLSPYSALWHRGNSAQVLQMQQADRQLPGYERDINKLIDDFALQAHQQQLISFATFKQLFQQGCYAYIHQAYWGCEHSTEYVQLLFAAALDRLDIPSVTAPQDSPLWQLHQLVPIGSTCMATMQSACSTRQPEPALQTEQSPSADHDMGTTPAAEPVVVDSWGGPDGSEVGLDLLDPAGMQMEEQQQHVPAQLQKPPQQLLQAQQDMQEQLQHSLLQQELQQQHHHHHHLQQQQNRQEQQQEEQQALLQQHHQSEQAQPLQQADDGAWASSPLRMPHQLLAPQGDHEAQAALLSPVDPMLLMSPLQQHTVDATASPELGDLEDLLLASPAVPAGSPPLQQGQPLYQAAHEAVYQQLQQHDGPQIQQAQLLQQQYHAHAAGAELQQHHTAQLQEQQDQQDQQAGGAPVLQEDDDEFLSDLLAILDEAMQEEEQLQAGAAVGVPERPVNSSHGDLAPAGARPQHGSQQQQQLVVQIPLVVKAAVIFTLLALHESQLNYPKVPVYVPLQLLKQLARAAAELRAAGGAAVDALMALHVLTSQQCLLVGQLRRPKCWEPMLPPALMPGGRLPCGLGPSTAIGAAARKAARSAAWSAMQSAAVAAAARAVRGSAAFDPGVHREALYHIKTALRGLSNFKSLQLLCDEYAAARRAVFDPLLGTGSSSTRQQQEERQPTTVLVLDERQPPKQAVTGAEVGKDTAAGPAAMIVQRGGSRRKRKAAAATAGAGNNKAGSTNSGPRAAAAAAAAAKGADEHEQQPAEAVGPGNRLGGPSVDVPELFDTNFATALQGLANSEASRMLLLLDPHYNASKVRKRTADERRAAKAAEAAAAAAAQQKLDRFQQLTMPSAAGQAQNNRSRQQQQSNSSAGGPVSPAHNLQQELVVAGVFTEQQLEDANLNLGSGMAPVSRGVQQVLRRAAEQRQATVQVAQEWLRADRAMVVDDGDEDMP